MASTADTAEILLDALQSIHDLKDQTVLVGLTGGSFEDKELRRQLLQDVYFLASVGARPVIVHGGSVPPDVYAEEKNRNAEREIATDLNNMLADEYESLGGRAMTLNFETGAVLFGDTDLDNSIGQLKSVDRIVVDNLCYAGQTPIIPAMCEGPSKEKILFNEIVATPFIASELAAKAAVIVAEQAIVGSASDDQFMDTAIGRAIKNGVQEIHLVSSAISHGLLLQLFSEQKPGIECREPV